MKYGKLQFSMGKFEQVCQVKTIQRFVQCKNSTTPSWMKHHVVFNAYPVMHLLAGLVRFVNCFDRFHSYFFAMAISALGISTAVVCQPGWRNPMQFLVQDILWCWRRNATIRMLWVFIVQPCATKGYERHCCPPQIPIMSCDRWCFHQFPGVFSTARLGALPQDEWFGDLSCSESHPSLGYIMMHRHVKPTLHVTMF